jgi:hypothetical protein
MRVRVKVSHWRVPEVFVECTFAHSRAEVQMCILGQQQKLGTNQIIVASLLNLLFCWVKNIGG